MPIEYSLPPVDPCRFTTLRPHGGSLTAALPKAIVDEYHLHAKDKLLWVTCPLLNYLILQLPPPPCQFLPKDLNASLVDKVMRVFTHMRRTLKASVFLDLGGLYDLADFRSVVAYLVKEGFIKDDGLYLERVGGDFI
jgi:hypothetical protein